MHKNEQKIERIIDFNVKGRPIPLKRHRATRRGVMYDPSKKDKENFLKKCLEHAPVLPPEEAIWVELVFNMQRPKSHYRTGKYSDRLKDDSPVLHDKKPDLDNLVKFVCDALNGVFYKDDSQITRLQARKVYGDSPSTEITIMEDIL